MSTTTTNYGLIKPDTTDPILIGQLNDNSDVIDATLKSLSDAIDTAKLGIKYKGEVNYYSNLPASGNEIGDAYTVKYAGSSGTTPDGTEYVWGAVSGTNQWINFSKDSYTKAEVDALLGGKVDKETGKGLSTNDFTTAEKTKLDDLAEIKSIGTGLNLDDNGELTATGGGSGGTTNYNDLSNKPQINGNTLSGNKTSAQLGLASASDIPTVPITAIQKNGTGITPVSGTVNITVPTQASDINAATATQGDKADTAIQGIKVNNSTVNPDSNKVVSITVPTTAADVSALPDTTKYAAALSLTINSSTYVVTGQLKDQNGDNLGTAQTIDLPLESVVVGGSYNSQTKKVVLTLQNGNAIEFSVADLVSGLQTELSASNKLNPAYINYDSTHRAVSDTEKSTWNGKQDALTTFQLAAANSGIDSTKVEQIETNKNNILFNTNNGVKNLSPTNSGSATRRIAIPLALTAGTYTVYIGSISSTDTDDTVCQIVAMIGNTVVSNDLKVPRTTGGAYTFNVTGTSTNVYIYASDNYAHSDGDTVTISDFMICKKSLYDADPTYQPYAMSNTDLTAKEQTNEAALIEIVDSGAKNIADFTSTTKTTYTTAMSHGVRITRNGDIFTISGTSDTHDNIFFNIYYDGSLSTKMIPPGNWVALIEDYTGSVVKDIAVQPCVPAALTKTYGIPFKFSLSGSESGNWLRVTIRPSTTYDGSFRLMICSKEDYTISPAFVPYAMSNVELTAAIQALQAQLANQ